MHINPPMKVGINGWNFEMVFDENFQTIEAGTLEYIYKNGKKSHASFG